MRMYCERRQDVKFGWEQPKLPYHRNLLEGGSLGGKVLENENWDGTIFDYQTCQPELHLTCPGYFNGEGVGTIFIPISYYPECGRKLGRGKEIDATNAIGRTIWYIGNACGKWECGEYAERCYVGCEKLRTSVVKSVVIAKVTITEKGTFISDDEIDSSVRFNINECGSTFFTSEEEAEEAKKLLDTALREKEGE